MRFVYSLWLFASDAIFLCHNGVGVDEIEREFVAGRR